MSYSTSSKKVAFIIDEYNFRGTSVALFDYAFFNQEILHNETFILSPATAKVTDIKAFEKFKKYFKIYLYRNNEELELVLSQLKISHIYSIRYGRQEDNYYHCKNAKNLVHCVFTANNPFGDVYAAVSNSVANTSSNKNVPVCNHIVSLPDLTTDYREQLNIPKSAIVLGRHGGLDTFGIPFVRTSIETILKEREDIYFLFAIRPTLLEGLEHPRVIYFDSFTDNRIKRKWINTCDAMIHASPLGESFGLSVMEFLFCGKSIVTWNGGIWHKQHISSIQNTANTENVLKLYNNESELVNILRSLKKEDLIKEENNCKRVVEQFSPEKVMKEFNDVFLS